MAMITASQPRPASTATEKTVTLANRPMMPGRQTGEAEQEEAEGEGGQGAAGVQAAVVA